MLDAWRTATEQPDSSPRDTQCQVMASPIPRRRKSFTVATLWIPAAEPVMTSVETATGRALAADRVQVYR